jgi:hypothetical protein
MLSIPVISTWPSSVLSPRERVRERGWHHLFMQPVILSVSETSYLFTSIMRSFVFTQDDRMLSIPVILTWPLSVLSPRERVRERGWHHLFKQPVILSVSKFTSIMRSFVFTQDDRMLSIPVISTWPLSVLSPRERARERGRHHLFMQPVILNVSKFTSIMRSFVFTQDDCMLSIPVITTWPLSVLSPRERVRERGRHHLFMQPVMLSVSKFTSIMRSFVFTQDDRMLSIPVISTWPLSVLSPRERVRERGRHHLFKQPVILRAKPERSPLINYVFQTGALCTDKVPQNSQHTSFTNNLYSSS